MDLRKQKTRQAIRHSFLQLRQEKNLEQITVKELAQSAQISKATFYLHYRDIFDLSEQLQEEAIQIVLSHMNSPLMILDNLSQFMREMSVAIEKENPLITALFSGSQAGMLPLRLEAQLKKYIFEHVPELRDKADLNVQLSYHFQWWILCVFRKCQGTGK